MMEPCSPVRIPPKPVVNKAPVAPLRVPVAEPLQAKPPLPRVLPATPTRPSPLHPPSPSVALGAQMLVRDLAITSEPAGAAVTIDGEERGFTPLSSVGLRPGRHHFAAQAQGYRSLDEDRVITPETRVIGLKLERVPEPPAPVALTAAADLPAVAAPRPRLSPSRKVLATWLGVNVGIALGTGIALAVMGNVKEYYIPDPDRMCDRPPCHFELYPHYSAAFGVAGVSLIGMVLSLTLPSHKKPAPNRE